MSAGRAPARTLDADEAARRARVPSRIATGGAVIEQATVGSAGVVGMDPAVVVGALAAAPPAVRIDGVCRSHPPRRGRRGREEAAVLANDHVTLTVGRGEMFGVLGPNGAGKSTLVRQLVGVLRPDEGRIEVLGHDITADPGIAPRLLAYLGQEEPALRELPVGLAVETTARLRGLSRTAARAARDDVLDELGLTGVTRRPLTALSGGQRRLAEVATALVGDRPLLVLDEPTTGLDPVARRSVVDALTRRRLSSGTTVVLVTHNVLEAEAVLDRVAVLDRGRVIACDTPGRLKALVSDQVRLDLVWRAEPPYGDPAVAALARDAVVTGRRWSVRLPQEQAREALGRLTGGPAMVALDDFRLTTPSLEDVYLALGGRDDDLERA